MQRAIHRESIDYLYLARAPPRITPPINSPKPLSVAVGTSETDTSAVGRSFRQLALEFLRAFDQHFDLLAAPGVGAESGLVPRRMIE